MSGYSGLDSWVRVTSDKMAEVLAKRLETALKGWNKAYGVPKERPFGDESERRAESPVDDDAPLPSVDLKITLEIILRNQEISAVPAMPIVRSLFLNALHAYFGVVCNLAKPKGGRYEVFDSITSARTYDHENGSEIFDNVVNMVPSKIIAESYSSIETHIREASAFVDQWLSYQTLWDTQVSDFSATIGDDIDKWRALLIEAAESRSTLDTSATESEFGPVLVKFGKVQSQINLKYDSWQKELQALFASILAQCISESHTTISSAREKLEATTLDSASTESIVLGVTFIQEVKQKVSVWAKRLEALRASEKLLKRQRFAFHSEWIETSVVKGQYDNLLQILEKRSRTMDQQVPLLQARVTAEDKSASKQLDELLKSWEDEKPLRGNMAPPLAMEILSKYEVNMNKANVHQQNLVRAKDALGIEHTMENMGVVESLNELADLKEVWQSVMVPYESLEQIRDISWATAVMRKIRRSLDDLLASMRSLPNRIRQYDAYTQLHDEVKGYIAGHGLLSDLKTEALKERHWKTILQRLGIQIPFTNLTIGVLWSNGVLTRKKEIHEILTVAQGEMALEVFLNGVRDRWTKQELDLVLFQNRTRLIRGWDDLFATLDDHISGLALMKSSPYYRAVREFQEEGKLWEDRLTKLRAAFDAWVDVQRRWVYLEGILFGSSDIKGMIAVIC